MNSFEHLQPIILYPMVSLGLIFVLIATRAYKRSYSTAVYILALAISIELMLYKEYQQAVLVLILGAVINLIRAVVNHEEDSWVKR